MLFNVLAVGDVCGTTGVDFLARTLPKLKREREIAFCVVNGENADNMGISPDSAETLLTYGADVITLGNHTYDKDNINNFLDDNRYILRPSNITSRAAGRGFGIYDSPAGELCVINLIGRVDMQPLSDNPFFELDRILKLDEVKACKAVLVDFHAETTSEKRAMAFHAEGRVAALWGTHTHVQTSDAEVMDGTGYITDLGMTGGARSILGMEPQTALERFLGNPKARLSAASAPAKLEGAVFAIDSDTGKCVSVETVRVLN